MPEPSRTALTGGAGRGLPLTAYACLASSMALVGSYVALSKLLVAVFPVLLLAWLRFGIAAVAMAGWVRREPGESPLSRRDRWLLFCESFLGNFLFSICMLYGVALTSALAAGVSLAAIPAAVALLSRWWLKERITGRVQLGIACAAGGVVLLSLARNDGGTLPQEGSWSALGLALLVAAVFCEASYVVIGKQLTGRVSPKRISALMNLWGWALVMPFGLPLAWHFDFGEVSRAQWGLLLFYALAASVVSVWLWMQGLRSVPAASAGIFTVMLPLAAAAVGTLLLGEPFSAAHLGALLLALLGLLLATWPRRAQESTAPCA